MAYTLVRDRLRGSISAHTFFNDNALLSAFFAALSSTFPAGEGEFIASVRLYRDKIKSPKLLEEMRGFIGQEGHHSHQHKQINEALRNLGIEAVKLEHHLERDLQRFTRRKFATRATGTASESTFSLFNSNPWRYSIAR